MNFPDVLSIRVTECGTQLPVSRAAFVLIFKGLKNDYYIGPTITNDSGTCKFTRSGCEEAISIAQSMFIMDYSGTLRDCQPVAELRMHSPEHIASMIRQFRSNPEFWGTPFKNPQEFFHALEKTTNDAFEPFHTLLAESEMLVHPEVKIALVRVGR